MDVYASKKVEKDGKEVELSCTVQYDFGGTVEKATALTSPEVVYSKYEASAKIDLQSYIRRLLVAGKKQEEIQKLAAVWKPGVSTRTRKSPMEKAAAALAGLSNEELEKLLKMRKSA